MSKVIILGGNARSGKSTLAFKLIKKGFSRISFDNLFDAIENSLNIKIDDLKEKQKFALFETIVDKAVEECEIENTSTVIDMYDFLPHDVSKLKNQDKIECYFLAYLKYNIVHYAKPTDWIAQVNNDYLNLCAKRFHDRNIQLVEECKQYNMILIDTMFKENREKIINELYDKIIEN